MLEKLILNHLHPRLMIERFEFPRYLLSTTGYACCITSPCVIGSWSLPGSSGGRDRGCTTRRSSFVASWPEVLERSWRRMLHFLQETMEGTIRSYLSSPRRCVLYTGKNIFWARRTPWTNLGTNLLRNRVCLAYIVHITGADVHQLSHDQVLYDGLIFFRISFQDEHHAIMTRFRRMRSCPLGHLLNQIVLGPVDRRLRHDVFQVQPLMSCPNLSRLHSRFGSRNRLM
mmetsp:Transcript_4279/g.15688  ORF Transcript_4279/g.15688 Transcript_4279/m.15688 type:complete len:228 (+) Transcript_4279:1451-2134(+)